MKPDNIFSEQNFRSSPFGPPESSGVYAVCIMRSDIEKGTPPSDMVVYIGSSLNIRKRVMNPSHIYRQLFGRLKNYWVYTMSFPCENYLDLERELIRKYQPRFNKYKYGS